MLGHEFGNGVKHLGGLFGIVAVHHFLAQGGAGARGQGGLHGDDGVGMPGAVAQQLIVRGQVGQHFLGVGAAIDGEKDFHHVVLSCLDFRICSRPAIQKKGKNGSSPLNTGAGSYQNNSIFPGLAFKVWRQGQPACP